MSAHVSGADERRRVSHRTGAATLPRMLMPSLHRRLTAWLAVLALVMGSLAPALGQAVAVSSGQHDWVQVCSASGMFWVRADEDPANPNPPSAEFSTACPSCSLYGGAPGLPPGLLPGAVLSDGTSPPPGLRPCDPSASVWAPAQARAPPVSA
jgi:hypothetical protein